MQPRELDRLVATKVMGWILKDNDMCLIPTEDRDTARASTMTIPYFSTNIGATYAMIEHCREQGVRFTMQGLTEGGWWAWCKKTKGTQVVAPTLMKAACEAALMEFGW